MSAPISVHTSVDTDVRRPGAVLAFLSVAQFMVFLDVSIVNVAMPSIQRALAISDQHLTYVVTVYGTVLGGFLLLASRLADRFGRRRVLRTGLAVFGLASLAAGMAQDPTTLFVARGMQGLGSALVAPAALSTLTTTFAEGPARARALGVWGALTGIASVAGVVLGGVLAEGPGWRWIFFLNVPVALAAVLAAPRVLPESRGRRERFDTVGALLLTVGLLVLIHTLDDAIGRGWGDARVVDGLLLAGVLLAAFLVVERRVPHPLAPYAVFRLPTLRTANLVAVFLLGAVVTLFYFASLFMQQVLGYSAMRTGLSYVPLALTVAMSAGAASVLVTRLPVRAVLLAGLALLAVGLLMLAQVPAHAAYTGSVLPAFLVTAVGMGLSFVTVQVAAHAGVGEERAGLAAGLINTSQELGGALGVAVAATVALGHGTDLLGVFHHAFLVGSGFAAVGLVLAAVLLPHVPSAQSTS